MQSLHLYGISGVPLVRPGDDLGRLLAEALRTLGLQMRQGDVIVVAHKVVSRAEGRLVNLADVTPGPEARRLASASGKDARLCELILGESRAILRVRPGLIVAEHRLGFICANAGIDRSNAADGAEWVVLLPEAPDESARRLRFDFFRRTGVAPGVLIADSHGRPFREGAVGVCIGVAGLQPLLSQVGVADLFGYRLQHTEEAVADEMAAAATLVMGQAHEAIPAVVVRGFFDVREAVGLVDEAASMRPLLRPKEKDLFR